MRPGPTVIFHVTEQQVTEVALAEYNDVVKAFPADRTDQPFSISILPRGARRRRSIADSYRSESANKDLTIGSVPITNEIAGSLFPPACFRDLICDPFSGGMRCDAKPQNMSPAVGSRRIHPSLRRRSRLGLHAPWFSDDGRRALRRSSRRGISRQGQCDEAAVSAPCCQPPELASNGCVTLPAC